MADEYPVITDWSAAGRRTVVETQGEVLRLLLDTAFTAFLDRRSLSAFGFDTTDPVAQAVEWCLHRFVTADIDPSKLHPESRSLRLFTEVGFWLAQKVGAGNVRRILSRATAEPEPSFEQSAQQELPTQRELTCQAVATRLGATLQQLGERTCADLVGFWLEATETERAEWFGWQTPGCVSEPAAGRSKKDRTLFRCDAQFRFQCLHRELLSLTGNLARDIVAQTLLSPCPNVPPYRRADALVFSALPELRLRGTRERRRLLKEGCASCLQHFITLLREWPEDGVDRLEWILLRRSVSASTLHAFDLEADERLKEQLLQLPSWQSALESES